MTVKQKRLLNELDKCVKENRHINLKELGYKVGYTKKSNKIYAKGIKRYMMERLKQLGTDDKSIIEGFNLSRELALKNNDLTNFNRANEDLARINGQFKDKIEADVKFKEIAEEANSIRTEIRNRIGGLPAVIVNNSVNN